MEVDEDEVDPRRLAHDAGPSIHHLSSTSLKKSPLDVEDMHLEHRAGQLISTPRAPPPRNVLQLLPFQTLGRHSGF